MPSENRSPVWFAFALPLSRAASRHMLHSTLAGDQTRGLAVGQALERSEMYFRSAKYYDHLYHFKDYAAASSELHARIGRMAPGAQSLLDVACGTGKHLEHLRHHYRAEGLDLNPDLLETAQRRCPDVLLHQGDMTDFDLGRTFDVVTCLFSAIAYVKSSENLRKTLCRLARHTTRGGLVFLEPFFSPETFRVGELTFNVANLPDAKIAWTYISRKEGTLGVLDVHHLVGTVTGIEYFTERHELGLFTHEEYVTAFEAAGLSVEYDPVGLFGRGMFVGTATNDVKHP